MPYSINVEATTHQECDGTWRGKAVVIIHEGGKLLSTVPHCCEPAREAREQAEADAEKLAATLRKTDTVDARTTKGHRR